MKLQPASRKEISRIAVGTLRRYHDRRIVSAKPVRHRKI